MKHASNKDPLNLRGLDPRIFGFEEDRVMHHRDIEQEVRATELYQRLVVLDKEELVELAGYRAGKQQLIASIIMSWIHKEEVGEGP